MRSIKLPLTGHRHGIDADAAKTMATGRTEAAIPFVLRMVFDGDLDAIRLMKDAILSAWPGKDVSEIDWGKMALAPAGWMISDDPSLSSFAERWLKDFRATPGMALQELETANLNYLPDAEFVPFHCRGLVRIAESLLGAPDATVASVFSRIMEQSLRSKAGWRSNEACEATVRAILEMDPSEPFKIRREIPCIDLSTTPMKETIEVRHESILHEVLNGQIDGTRIWLRVFEDVYDTASPVFRAEVRANVGAFPIDVYNRIGAPAEPLLRGWLDQDGASLLFRAKTREQTYRGGEPTWDEYVFAISMAHASPFDTDRSIEMLRAYHACRVDLNTPIEMTDGPELRVSTMLHHAVTFGHPEFVSEALRLGADPTRMFHIKERVTGRDTTAPADAFEMARNKRSQTEGRSHNEVEVARLDAIVDILRSHKARLQANALLDVVSQASAGNRKVTP